MSVLRRRNARAWQVGAAVLLLLALVLPWRQTLADDDPFSATVTVDATADNVAKARDLARLEGQRSALNAVVDKLSGAGAKLPKLSDNQIADMVVSFEVANEKMTAVRYVADYTYHFKASAVQTMLANAGISTNAANPGTANSGTAPAAGTQPNGGKPIVVVPVLEQAGQTTLWDEPNPWRHAWQERATSGAKLLVPLGDVGDVATIDAEKAQAGDAAALAAIATKYNADDVLVLLASERRGDKSGLDVTARRYRDGQLVDTHTDAIDANPGEKNSDLFHRAVDTIAADIVNGWKAAKEPSGPLSSIVVVLPITGLDDWIRERDQLTGLTGIRRLDVQSLSRQEATIGLQYVGDLDQLKSNLATIGLALQGGDPTWRLARSGGDRH